MSDLYDPRRPDHTAYLKQRIKITKTKLESLELRLFHYAEEADKITDVMDNFIQGFVIYGTEEAGETGSLLRAMARILKKANSYQKQRVDMLVQVGENLRHVKSIYRNARDTLADYHDTTDRLKSAQRRFQASSTICSRTKTARKAKETLVRVKSELFHRKTALNKELDDFDKELRAKLMKFFFQFVKCEMITAARLLESYSESHKKLERWTSSNFERSAECEWVTKTDMNLDIKGF